MLTVFCDVAYEAHLPALVSREELVEGNSKLTASAAAAEFGAFSLAGWLVQWLTAPTAVLIDALSFVWSACFIARIRTPEPPPTSGGERAAVWREARDGMSLVFRDPILCSLAVAGVTTKFFGQIIGVSILLYLAGEVGFSPGMLGLVFGIGGVTSLAGAVLAGRQRGRTLGPSLVVALAVRAAGAVFIPLAGAVSASGLGLLVMSQLVTDPAWAFYEINEVSLRQAITADRLRGRMNASMRFLDFGAMLGGTLVAGVLGEWAGPRAALWVAAGGLFTAALWLLRSPVFRLKEIPSATA
jgi:hypothetical protein